PADVGGRGIPRFEVAWLASGSGTVHRPGADGTVVGAAGGGVYLDAVARGSGGGAGTRSAGQAAQRWQDGAAVEYFSGGAASLSVGFPSPLTLLSPPQPRSGEGSRTQRDGVR